jgi:hypothetical protein
MGVQPFTPGSGLMSDGRSAIHTWLWFISFTPGFSQVIRQIPEEEPF